MSKPEIEHRIREQAIPTQNTPTGAWAIMVPGPLFHEAVAELERLRSKPQDWQAGFAAGIEAAATTTSDLVNEFERLYAGHHAAGRDDSAARCAAVARATQRLYESIRAIAVPQEPTPEITPMGDETILQWSPTGGLVVMGWHRGTNTKLVSMEKFGDEILDWIKANWRMYRAPPAKE